MRSSPLFASLVLLILSLTFVQAVDLRLVVDYGGKRYPVVDMRKASAVIVNDGVKQLLREPSFALEGSEVPSLKIGYSPLFYTVDRRRAQQVAGRQGPEPHRYVVGVNLLLDPEDSPVWSEEDIRDVWPAGDLQSPDATWIVAWWDRTTASWADVAAVARYTSLHELVLEISEEELSGRPVILLWKNGRFIAPKTYANAEENTLFARLQKGLIPLEEELDGAPAVDSRGYHWIQYAASWGELSWIEKWRDRIFDESVARSRNAYPLVLAGMHGHAGVVTTLLESGYEASREDDVGFDTGHAAAKSGHPDVIKTLLDAGYSPRSRARDGLYEPIHLALEYNHDDVFGLLRASDVPLRRFNVSLRDQLLAYHAAQGNPEIVGYILSRKADPNAMVSTRSILSHAVIGGNLAVLSTLLAAGADPNAPVKDSPLATACYFNNMEMTRMLLEAGADPNPDPSLGSHPLRFAVLHGNRALLRLLLDHGAEPEAVAKADDPLGLVETAAAIGNRDIVSELFAAGARCHFSEDLADEMLILAMHHDVLEMAVLAFEACVSPDFKFYDTYNLNWVAQHYGATAVSDWFQEAGYADSTAPDNLVSPAELDTRPTVVSGILPPYTEELFLRYGNLEDRILLLVDEEGIPRFPRSRTRSLPPPIALELFLSYLPQWRFSPGMVDGKPVKSIVSLPLSFTFEPEPLEGLEMSQVTVPPQRRRAEAPRYPVPLKQAHVTGTVKIHFLITREGKVKHPRILRSPHPLFSHSTMEAVRKWEFSPATLDGKPVSVWARQEIPFSLR